MKAIEPDAIPELKWMPWILGGLIVTGLGVAALGRRLPLFIWGSALVLLFAVGLWDYWRWGYDYGHNLDYEHAIIKVPGMTYQPPLIGRKKLLNFTATSWPSGGGIAMGLAAGLHGGRRGDERAADGRSMSRRGPRSGRTALGASRSLRCCRWRQRLRAPPAAPRGGPQRGPVRTTAAWRSPTRASPPRRSRAPDGVNVVRLGRVPGRVRARTPSRGALRSLWVTDAEQSGTFVDVGGGRASS